MHGNALEMAPTTFVALLAGGLFFPNPAAAAGVAVFVGRALYAFGYQAPGFATVRIAGSLMIDVAILLLIGLAVYGSASAAGLA